MTPAEGRKFGLLVGGAFLLLGALLWRRTHLTAATVALVLGCGLIVGGLVLPTHLGPVYRGWMKLAEMIPWAPSGYIEIRPVVDFGQ